MKKIEKIPQLLLEQYALGELSAENKAKVEAYYHELGPHALAESIQGLQLSNEKILREYPANVLFQPILQRESKNISPWVPVLGGGFAFTLLIFFLVPVFLNQPTERMKGLEPHLLIYKKDLNETQVEKLNSGTVVSPSTLLQIAYVAANAQYGMIFSLDGRGKVTFHFPELSETNAKKLASGETFLYHSFELDDSPEFEKFIFVTSQNTFQIKEVLQKILPILKNASKSDSVNIEGLQVSVFTLYKKSK